MSRNVDRGAAGVEEEAGEEEEYVDRMIGTKDLCTRPRRGH